jgi:tetratricopeptide (TPR) repeat protein
MVNTLPPPTSLPAEATPTIEAFAAALKRVTAEPDNPLAHFNLGAAYWEAGMMAEAEAEFQLASQLTGAKPNAYMHLGDIFRMRERPILAARAYIEAVKLTADPLPTELVERLAEAMYLAAKDASANKAGFDEESVKRADPQILDIARARYLLYQGNIEGADQALEVILASEKVRPEAKLLQAEILYAQDEKDEARQKLEALKQDPNLPLWVRLFTEKFINQVKP